MAHKADAGNYFSSDLWKMIRLQAEAYMSIYLATAPGALKFYFSSALNEQV